MSAIAKPALDDALVANLARFAEGLLTEQQVKKKHRFDDATWERLGDDAALLEAVEEEKIKRERLGLTAKERAQRSYSSAPLVLDGILNSKDGVSPRHKIEAAREIRAIASAGSEAKSADRFTIVIDLSADSKLKSIEPDPHDVIVVDAEVPTALIAARKASIDDGGSHGGAPR